MSGYSGFDNAVAEMQRLHYTYLNRDYNQDALNSWGAKIDVVRRSLGYRLTLQNGTYASSSSRGGTLPITLVLRNDGYAPPIGPSVRRLAAKRGDPRPVSCSAAGRPPPIHA